MSDTAFGVCLLINPADFSRLLYVCQALCDLLLVADAAWIVQALARAGNGVLTVVCRDLGRRAILRALSVWGCSSVWESA